MSTQFSNLLGSIPSFNTAFDPLANALSPFGNVGSSSGTLVNFNSSTNAVSAFVNNPIQRALDVAGFSGGAPSFSGLFNSSTPSGGSTGFNFGFARRPFDALPSLGLVFGNGNSTGVPNPTLVAPGLAPLTNVLNLLNNRNGNINVPVPTPAPAPAPAAPVNNPTPVNNTPAPEPVNTPANEPAAEPQPAAEAPAENNANNPLSVRTGVENNGNGGGGAQIISSADGSIQSHIRTDGLMIVKYDKGANGQMSANENGNVTVKDKDGNTIVMNVKDGNIKKLSNSSQENDAFDVIENEDGSTTIKPKNEGDGPIVTIDKDGTITSEDNDGNKTTMDGADRSIKVEDSSGNSLSADKPD
ncbi:MAG: hypothetical protein KTR14_11775 [Vampirovibrio sp.]|nr:hypothetical protein [Vampirovibrio sp.]